MDEKQAVGPDNTAVRVALWRALHVEADAPPHVFEDVVGLKLAAPDEGWRSRPDMSPFTRPFRASIVARARFIEDLVVQQAARGVGQYVILGAGLDGEAARVRAKMVEFQGKLRDEAHAKGERLRARRAHPTGFGDAP